MNIFHCTLNHTILHFTVLHFKIRYFEPLFDDMKMNACILTISAEFRASLNLRFSIEYTYCYLKIYTFHFFLKRKSIVKNFFFPIHSSNKLYQPHHRKLKTGRTITNTSV